MTDSKDKRAADAASPAFAALCSACGEYLKEQNGHVDEDCGSLHYAVKQAIDTLGDDPNGPAEDAPKAPEKIP